MPCLHAKMGMGHKNDQIGDINLNSSWLSNADNRFIMIRLYPIKDDLER